MVFSGGAVCGYFLGSRRNPAFDWQPKFETLFVVPVNYVIANEYRGKEVKLPPVAQEFVSQEQESVREKSVSKGPVYFF